MKCPKCGAKPGFRYGLFIDCLKCHARYEDKELLEGVRNAARSSLHSFEEVKSAVESLVNTLPAHYRKKASVSLSFAPERNLTPLDDTYTQKEQRKARERQLNALFKHKKKRGRK